MNADIETKTKDNVFVVVQLAIQYMVGAEPDKVVYVAGIGSVLTRRPAVSRAFSPTVASRRLRPYELAGPVDDDLSVGDLRWVRECRLELFLAQPVRRDAG